MKVLLTLMLVGVLTSGRLWAQAPPALATYTDARARYQLQYPATWRLQSRGGGAVATFAAGDAGAPGATVTLTLRPLPDAQKERKLTADGRPDSVLRRLQQLPRGQVLSLTQRDYGSYDELRYDYRYAPATANAGASPAGPTRVLGRQIWRGGYEFRVEYRGPGRPDGRYLAEGRALVASFAFAENDLPSRRYADQQCDDKLYGIAALRLVDGQWEDDCRTIHEFPAADPTAAPVVHRWALPFQSYALAKGFDNCLYAVSKAPTDAPERVYRYDPATRQGRYTAWQLPPQGPDVVWISAATDERGDLYFMTSDARQLVKVSPYDGSVTSAWAEDPVRAAPYYPLIGFPGAGTHGNFCLDDARTMYLVYSTDGSLLKVNLTSHRPDPERVLLSGLPARGGYSDLLLQNDAAGRRRLYLAGPHALYQVDLARRRATRVRGGTYTDLAGCNLFRVLPRAVPAPPPAATATWQGRVLDAVTARPLPEAQLRVTLNTTTALLLSTQATFTYTTAPGRSYQYHAELPGYFPTDSTWVAAPGRLVQDILLRPLAVGTTFQLANVQFEQGKAALLPSSFAALTKLVNLLVDNPGLSIELRGHTDNVGPPEPNVVLSQQRVAAVKAYLTDHGVAAARVSGQGFGGTQPLASNEQEATRRLNRRVEFRIVGL